MVAFSFSGEVIRPVVVELSVGLERAELEDRFGALEAPAGAGDVHAIFHEVPARAFDHAGRDGPAVLQRGGVVEVGALVEEVGRAAVRALAVLRVEAGGGSLCG